LITPPGGIEHRIIGATRAAARARGANVIAVGSEGDQEISAHASHVIFVPRVPELFAPVVVTPPLQLLAYHVAKVRGCDVDQPRNLAKSVTVE
jgi:glucosamine--fructose-6-phosphate aminotransferase (isomerizing)